MGLRDFLWLSSGKDRANLYDSNFDVGHRASSTVDASVAATPAQGGLNKSYRNVARARAPKAPSSAGALTAVASGPIIEHRRAPTRDSSPDTSDPFSSLASDGHALLRAPQGVRLEPSKIDELSTKLEEAVRCHRETEEKLRAANLRADSSLEDATSARGRAETAEAHLSQARLELHKNRQMLQAALQQLESAQRDLEVAQSTPSGMTMVQKLSEGDLISGIELQQRNLLAAADTLYDDLEHAMPEFMSKAIGQTLRTDLPFLGPLSHAAAVLGVSVGSYLPPALNQIVLRTMCLSVWEDFVPGLTMIDKAIDASMKATYARLRETMPNEWVQVSIWRQFTVRQLYAQTHQRRDLIAGITRTALQQVSHLLDVITAATDQDAGLRLARTAPFHRFETALSKVLGDLIDLKLRAQTEAGIVDIKLSFSPPSDLTRTLGLDTPVCVQSVERHSLTYASHGQVGTSNHQPTVYGLAGNIFGEDAFVRPHVARA